jgi:cell wall-associated NlpC family hydrolase
MIVTLAAALGTGCASSGGVPRPFPTPGGRPPISRGPDVAEPAAPSRGGLAVVGAALDLRGAPYRLGGADPSGFDCSGLVSYVFSREGISLPRTVSEQRLAGALVAPGDLRPGDLLFFATAGSAVSHVAIALGDGQFVHAPSEGGSVRVDRLDLPYWAERFVEARRVPNW